MRTLRLILLSSLALSGLWLGTPVPHLAGPTQAAPEMSKPDPGVYFAYSGDSPGSLYHLTTTGPTTVYTRPSSGLLTQFVLYSDGTLFFLDTTANTIYTVAAGSTAATAIYSPSSSSRESLRDLAVDGSGTLYFSEVRTSSSGPLEIYGDIYTLTTASPYVATHYLSVPTGASGVGNWGGIFAFETLTASPSTSTLWVSTLGILFEDVGGTFTKEYSDSTHPILGFAFDRTGAIYFAAESPATPGIYLLTLGPPAALAVVWHSPAGSTVSDVQVVDNEPGPVPVAFGGCVTLTPGVQPRTQAAVPPGGAPTLPQPGVPLSLFGINASPPSSTLLDSDVSSSDGCYGLGNLQTGFQNYEVQEGVFRGAVPHSASPGTGGTVVDPATVMFGGTTAARQAGPRNNPASTLPTSAGSTRSRCSPFSDRYLIVTSNAIANFRGAGRFRQLQGVPGPLGRGQDGGVAPGRQHDPG